MSEKTDKVRNKIGVLERVKMAKTKDEVLKLFEEVKGYKGIAQDTKVKIANAAQKVIDRYEIENAKKVKP